ncbi:hypothetical protein ACFYY1_29780 [Streptomyces sp. NPDC001890]|uniref:hypothetical protein n=1 Tax=Streptomyces sp. NPDC001890 TaxID=3364620 RepID=UPI0036C4E286
MHTDLSMISRNLLLLSTGAARDLGPSWKVEGLLGSALIVHPLGFRVMADGFPEHILLTAHILTSPHPDGSLAKVTVRVPRADDETTWHRIADAIRIRMIHHFGRADAVAGLRVMSQPLREAGINATAQGSTQRTTIERGPFEQNRPADDGTPGPFQIIITAPQDDSTRVELRIPFLPVKDATRIAAATLPAVYAPVPAGNDLPDEARQIAADLPGLTAQRATNNGPRCTDLTDPSGTLTIRHALEATDTGTRSWAAIWLRNAPVATAYAAIRAYATR